ncbi:MAG: ABC transporter permease [Bacteroidota bacterium]
MRFLTELLEGLRIAMQAVWANKLRALLTTLGIIIGIATVTTMFTVINGIEQGFDRSMDMLGTNVYTIERTPDGFDNDWWKYRSRPRIREELAYYIDDRKSENLEFVTPVSYAGFSIQYQDRRISGTFARAATPALADINNFELDAGRFYNETDYQRGRPVAVIGMGVANELFPIENPIGKRIRVGGQRLEVIGVLEEQGKFLGLISFDEQVMLPLTTFKRLYDSDPYIEVQAKAASPDVMVAAFDELTGLTRAFRGLDALDDDNFAIQSTDAFEQQTSGVKGAIYGVGLFLTALSLLVGGIGVMNIMFVSVKERTREIGIRKAIGAPRRAILTQFLIEAVVVCLLGGLIGVGIAALAAMAIDQVFTAQLSPATVGLAFSICVGVGVGFGFVPAWTAAKARPIEALRYE